VSFASSQDFEKNVRDADIIIASSGMLQPYATALKYYKVWAVSYAILPIILVVIAQYFMRWRNIDVNL